VRPVEPPEPPRSFAIDSLVHPQLRNRRRRTRSLAVPGDLPRSLQITCNDGVCTLGARLTVTTVSRRRAPRPHHTNGVPCFCHGWNRSISSIPAEHRDNFIEVLRYPARSCVVAVECCRREPEFVAIVSPGSSRCGPVPCRRKTYWCRYSPADWFIAIRPFASISLAILPPRQKASRCRPTGVAAVHPSWFVPLVKDVILQSQSGKLKPECPWRSHL